MRLVRLKFNRVAVGLAATGAGIYRPNWHVERIRDDFVRQGKDPEAFVRFHVRRLEALRRAGHMERIDADHWRVPNDIVDRGMAYDLSQGGDSLRVRTLSILDLEQQIRSDRATWLDRDMVSSNRMRLVKSGFGLEVASAFDRRAERLVQMGQATREPDGAFIPCRAIWSPLWSGGRSSGSGRNWQRHAA